MTTAIKKGEKFDTGKRKWYRMPLSVLKPLADVYCIAGLKHEPFNCLLPFDDWQERLYDPMMRHIEASQLDPLAINEEDGGVYHLAQVAFNALTLLDNALREEREQVETGDCEGAQMDLDFNPSKIYRRPPKHCMRPE